jgi:hypothetical protein
MKDQSGTLGTVIATERRQDGNVHLTDVQVDAGAGDTTTAELYQAPGEDSLPMAGDTALLQEAPGSGVKAVVGFDDPNNAGTAEPGERRGYSRQADGTPAAEYHLKANGDVVIRSFVATGTIYIESAGPVIVKSPDVRLGDETASRQVACIGDIIAGSIRATVALPSVQPLLPAPGSTPTPTGGVPFTGQIISGSPRAKAT